MPNELFQIDLSNLINLRKFYRRAPKQFLKATNSTLNSFAFGTRKRSLEIIEKKMTIRNQKFVAGSLRVQKSTGTNINNARSEVGSINRPRFTGWKEQELGTKPERSRSITSFGRGTKNRRLRPSFKMRPGNNFLDSDDFDISGGGDRTVVFLQMLARRKQRKPFIIKGSSKFKSGLYVFRRKKIKRIQTFKETKKIKRVRWMSGGRREFFRTADINKIWAESLRRVLKFR
ncbi:MAG: hypothetical protein V3U02_11335 [Calditrichia bacterium]